MKYNLPKWPRWLRDFAPLIGWMALIFVLSAQPVLINIENEVREISLYKSAHFFAYAMLAWFWWRALAPQRQASWPPLLIACLLTTLYGVSDEIHQLYVSGRYGRVADVLFDTAGAVSMILLLRYFLWLRLFPETLPFVSQITNINRQSELS